MQSNKNQNINQGMTALYCRLSRDDGSEGDSNSIANQKKKIKLETSIMETLSKSKNIVKIFETYETKKHI